MGKLCDVSVAVRIRKVSQYQVPNCAYSFYWPTDTTQNMADQHCAKGITQRKSLTLGALAFRIITRTDAARDVSGVC